MNTAQLTALAAELTSDPLDRGYSGMSDYDASVDLKALYRPAIKQSVTQDDLLSAIDSGEYAAQVESVRKEVLDIIGKAPFNPQKFGYLRLIALFGSTSVTAGQLSLARTYYVARYTELRTAGEDPQPIPAPSTADVQAARAL
jgi:hypothetical protein